MKSDYELRAQRFIRDIFPFIRECDHAYEYRNAVNMFNSARHRKVGVQHGQTRVVLITSDYVVKIDYGTRARYFGGCEDEMVVYNRAVREGYDYLFARITPYSYGGRVFYIMPRISGIGEADDEAYDLVTPEEADWLMDNVQDLHYQNFGFVNGRVVLVDYACREDIVRSNPFPSTWYSSKAQIISLR